MLKIFIGSIFLIISISVSSQITKIYNTENPDSNYFGYSVSLWGDLALIRNNNLPYGFYPDRNYDLHLFENKNIKWKEIQAFKINPNIRSGREKKAVIYNDKICYFTVIVFYRRHIY